ncbi:nitrite reductase [Nocardioides currus]|uniref:Nitrite reductase n=1 Tax=Nocardioides currus TaxID=2133958 RepID=A0A2R7Z1G0_9ACTN|nr:nitrite reductase [Nocardioides currus]PUA82086.1 nitrite reductase [Nocardioides currus]
MSLRTRGDLCPGALRPWPAPDGLLVRLRLIGGVVPTSSLLALSSISASYGDGLVHLTSRANLQLRGLPGSTSALDPAVLAALVSTGLLPCPTHELVRNVMVSPGPFGRADLGPVAASLDELLCADPVLASLSGRFLFVLDDGRGDLLERECDLGLVALSPSEAQLRVGTSFGPVVPLSSAAGALAELAHAFAVRRGAGASAPWHVAELDSPLVPTVDPDPRLPSPSAPLPFGDTHLPFPEGLTHDDVLALSAPTVVVTPWRGVLIPEETA